MSDRAGEYVTIKGESRISSQSILLVTHIRNVHVIKPWALQTLHELLLWSSSLWTRLQIRINPRINSADPAALLLYSPRICPRQRFCAGTLLSGRFSNFEVSFTIPVKSVFIWATWTNKGWRQKIPPQWGHFESVCCRHGSVGPSSGFTTVVQAEIHFLHEVVIDGSEWNSTAATSWWAWCLPQKSIEDTVQTGWAGLSPWCWLSTTGWLGLKRGPHSHGPRGWIVKTLTSWPFM